MKIKITLALSAFAIFSFIPFYAVAEQKLVSKAVITINQPTFQISKDQKLILIDKQGNKKVVTKGGVYEPSKGVRIWVKNGKVAKTTGLPARKPDISHTTGQSNKNAVILSEARLSNWNRTRAESVKLTSQIKVAPKKRKVISNVMQTLDEIDGLLQRVAELQKNPQKNKSALMKASVELKKYGKQIERLQKDVKFLYQEQGTSGEDAQLANIDMQNKLQKQQQLIQMLSKVSKVLHDTAMAVVRKIG